MYFGVVETKVCCLGIGVLDEVDVHACGRSDVLNGLGQEGTMPTLLP